MQPLKTICSIAAPLPGDNVDTDTIIPSREMTSTGRAGLAGGLFAPLRYLDAAARIPDPSFVLNRAEFAGAKIIAAGANFGCGSSREHAVWALAEWGIRAILAQSFAPIFAQNCLRNGILPVALDKAAIAAVSGRQIKIDLAAQTVAQGGRYWPFAIDREARTMLLEGLDAIDLTFKSREAIARWTDDDRLARPWVYLERWA